MSKHALASFLLAACLVVGSACSKGVNAPQQNGAAAGNAAATAAPAPSDVEFAREAFGRLAAGDAAVEGMIDWENFAALGEDYGADYRNFPEDARATERKAFVEGFAREFKESGGDAQRITNWREEAREGDRAAVAADLPTGIVLLVEVTRRDGRQLLSALDLTQPDEAPRRER